MSYPLLLARYKSLHRYRDRHTTSVNMATRHVLATLALLVTLAHGMEDPCAPNCSTGDELIPHPRSCAYFYQCSNGIPYLQSCPLGLHFAPSVLYCDYPGQAHCTARPDVDCGDVASTETVPPPKDITYSENTITPSENTITFSAKTTTSANDIDLLPSGDSPSIANCSSSASNPCVVDSSLQNEGSYLDSSEEDLFEV